MHQAPLQHLVAFVGKLIVVVVNGGLSGLVLLHMVHLRLQQADNDVAFHKSITGELNRGELQRSGRGIAAIQFELPTFLQVGQLRGHRADCGIRAQMSVLDDGMISHDLQREFGSHARQPHRRKQRRRIRMAAGNDIERGDTLPHAQRGMHGHNLLCDGDLGKTDGKHKSN